MSIEFLALALTLFGAITAYIHSVSKHATELMRINMDTLKRLAELEKELINSKHEIKLLKEDLVNSNNLYNESKQNYRNMIAKAKRIIINLQKQIKELKEVNSKLRSLIDKDENYK